jgi:hypothetical protein
MTEERQGIIELKHPGAAEAVLTSEEPFELMRNAGCTKKQISRVSHYLDGKTTYDIAAYEGVEPSSVRRSVHSGLARIGFFKNFGQRKS